MATRPTDRNYMLFGTRIVGDFGATIAVPVVLFAWIGKTLDARWGSGPWMLILGFVLAAAFSTVSLVRKARIYGREYQSMIDRENEASKVKR